MRKTLGVCLLVLLLTGTTSAGVIPNMPPAPPSEQTGALQEPTGANQDQTADGIMPNDATESLTQAALDLLALLPTLL